MQTNQKGFILYECLLSLVILSVVLTTVIQLLPQISTAKVELEHEQSIFNQLYSLKDQLLFQGLSIDSELTFTSPIPYRVTIEQQSICATYFKGDVHEKKLCL